MIKSLLTAAILLSVAGCKTQKTESEGSKTPSKSTTATTPKPKSTGTASASGTPTTSSNNASAGTSATSKPETNSNSITPAKSTGVATTTSTSASQGRLAETFVKEGETLNLPERQMKITFKKITEDSRCPQGAECVWQGVAVAELTFDGYESKPVTVQLASQDLQESRGYGQSTVYNGYKISLKSVAPYPKADNQGSLKGKYVIGLMFENANPKKGKSGIDPAVIRK